MGLDKKTSQDLNESKTAIADGRISRRQAIKLGAGGLACVAATGAAALYVSHRVESVTVAEVFKNDAPRGRLWQ